VRGTIKIDSVTWELKNNDVAYIHIVQFDQSLQLISKKAANEILKSPAKNYLRFKR